MSSQWKFALLLLDGIGLLLVSFGIVSNWYSWVGWSLLNNPNGLIMGQCDIGGRASACPTWPWLVLALFVVGMIAMLAGVVGLLEEHIPREDR